MENRDSQAPCHLIELPLSVIRLAGSDRAKFLHNFCTADIKKLQTDQYSEAFFLDHKGKTLSHGFVISREIDLLIVSTSKSADELLQHLDKFLLSDDVQLSDVSSLWRSTFVYGDKAVEKLEAADVSVPNGNHAVTSGFQVVINAELAGEGVLILQPREGDVDLVACLVEQGATKTATESFHLLRIENQTPWCDSEITDSCLPQEFRRDAKAISFTKGCYLGQETVARLDALGHVNRFFVGFELVSGEAHVGDVLRIEGKKVGTVTSMSGSLGLGFLRVEFAKSGEVVACEGASIRVR